MVYARWFSIYCVHAAYTWEIEPDFQRKTQQIFTHDLRNDWARQVTKITRSVSAEMRQADASLIWKAMKSIIRVTHPKVPAVWTDETPSIKCHCRITNDKDNAGSWIIKHAHWELCAAPLTRSSGSLWDKHTPRQNLRWWWISSEFFKGLASWWCFIVLRWVYKIWVYTRVTPARFWPKQSQYQATCD